jgi:hypothetical protein
VRVSEGKFQRVEYRFDAAGLGLTTPPDQDQPTGQHPVLVNVRHLSRGEVRQRPGLNTHLTAPANRTPWHSLRRLVDSNASDYTYIAGIDTYLATGKTGTLTEREGGFSGNPLTMVPFRPPQSPGPWMAVADTLKMRKVRHDGTVRPLGLAAPTRPPDAELALDGPLWAQADAGDATTGWSNGPGGEVPALANRISTTITHQPVPGELTESIFGDLGWYAIPLTSLENITPGTLLRRTGGSPSAAFVEEIHPGSPASAACTVSRVISDGGATTGATGWVTIVPSVPLEEFQQHAFLLIAGSIRTAVTTKVEGLDGQISLRCWIGAFSTVSPGNAIVVLPSVFAHVNGPLGTGDTLASSGVKWTGLAASTRNVLTRGTYAAPLNLNLSSFAFGDRKVHREFDDMVCSIYLSDPSRLAEMKLEIDVGKEFSGDYFTRSVSPHELVPVTRNTISSVDARAAEIRRALQAGQQPGGGSYFDLIQLPDVDPFASPRTPIGGGDTNLVDPIGSPASKTGTGGAQWFTVRFKLSDFKRIGSSSDAGLHKVTLLRFSVATTDGGTIDFAFDDWMIVGGYEPDITFGGPYEYRYRYRDSSTGTRSNWSPPSRNLIRPRRYPALVQCFSSAAAGVDKIDVQRRGGLVNDWRTVGSIPNSGAQFRDVYSDDHALGVGMDALALEGNVNAEPFTVRRGPLTIANGIHVSGTMVYDATGRFNLQLAHGTPLRVNSIPTLVYQVHSANLLEVYNHCGAATSAPLEIPEQFITGQPLPVIFGDLDGWSFALGDSYNPCRLYFFNRYTLDSTQGRFYLDVTDTSALLNGCVYNGRAYVWTSEGMYAVSFSGDDDVFRSDVVTGGVGLYARWALTTGDVMYWLGKDGVYSSDGGSTVNITRRDLLPLFSNEGQTGTSVGPIPAPHMPQNATVGDIAALRLCYAHDKYLYFDYRTAAGLRRTLVLDRSDGERWGWYADTYAAGNGAVFHYADEGEGVKDVLVGAANTGTAGAYTLGGNSRTDAGSAFQCQVRTLALDGGDLRGDKLVGDGYVNLSPGGGTLTPTFWFNDFATSIAGPAFTGAAERQDSPPVDFNAGAGQYARNVAIELTWSVTGDTVNTRLYGWGFSVMGRPERTVKRATDFSDMGHWGPKELKGVSVECDTGGATKNVIVEYTAEDGTVKTVTRSIRSTQKDIVHVSFDPVVCYEARLRPSDNEQWRLYGVAKWHFEPLTDLTGMTGDWHHFERAVWVQGVEIDGDTNGAAVTTTIQRDFSEPVRTIIATHPGRGTKAYAFTSPFIAYMVRTAPAGLFRRMRERWIYEPEAPIGTVWETQEFELGDPYGFARSAEVEYAAASNVTLRYYVDGVEVFAGTLAGTGTDETFRKRQLDLPAIKGRLGKLRLECSTGVRVRVKGTLLARKAFAGELFEWVPVAGDTHNESGARV